MINTTIYNKKEAAGINLLPLSSTLGVLIDVSAHCFHNGPLFLQWPTVFAFFAGRYNNLIEEMRKTHPDFGRACYTDSTPLPGEAENNPFNALCSHGTDGAVIQSRLVLLLDICNGPPEPRK